MEANTRRLVYCVDDEENLRVTLSYALEKEGYRCSVFSDGDEAWAAMEMSLPDLAVIDITMPRMDGLELCRRIRRVSETLPVIFLTSRDEEIDRILGLELGADDYLTKPFSMRELLARIKVIFRRIEAYRKDTAGPVNHEDNGFLQAGPLYMDTHRYTVRWNTTPIPMTVTEFRILAALIKNPGVVKTREQLLHEAYPEDLYVSDRSADSHIKRIRKKIQAVDPLFSSIETLYGLGYTYRDPEDPVTA
ncbi:MAG: response regulator transcription factor [Spirochaetales bacterium]|nr:response regulator transcription factor [Spirochaetales bacterium]